MRKQIRMITLLTFGGGQIFPDLPGKGLYYRCRKPGYQEYCDTGWLTGNGQSGQDQTKSHLGRKAWYYGEQQGICNGISGNERTGRVIEKRKSGRKKQVIC